MHKPESSLKNEIHKISWEFLDYYYYYYYQIEIVTWKDINTYKIKRLTLALNNPTRFDVV